MFGFGSIWKCPKAPEPPAFSTHRAWAGAQRFNADAMTLMALLALNPAVRHCRIGKIIPKSNAR